MEFLLQAIEEVEGNTLLNFFDHVLFLAELFDMAIF